MSHVYGSRIDLFHTVTAAQAAQSFESAARYVSHVRSDVADRATSEVTDLDGSNLCHTYREELPYWIPVSNQIERVGLYGVCYIGAVSSAIYFAAADCR